MHTTLKHGQTEQYLILVAVCWLAYFVSYWVQARYLVVFDFMPKASLFFFPAGIRLVAFLAARSAGLLGVSLGTLTAATLDTSWHPPQLHDYISIVVFFCVLPYLGTLAAQRFLQIDQQLGAIKVWQIAAIAALVSVVNGTSINIYMLIENVITLSDFDTGVFAAVVGDMSGIAVVLFMVSFSPSIYRTAKQWFE